MSRIYDIRLKQILLVAGAGIVVVVALVNLAVDVVRWIF